MSAAPVFTCGSHSREKGEGGGWKWRSGEEGGGWKWRSGEEGGGEAHLPLLSGMLHT
jgi:hypothetical protein